MSGVLYDANINKKIDLKGIRHSIVWLGQTG